MRPVARHLHALQGTLNSAAEMRAIVFFDGPGAAAKLSRFWILLCLSAVIASAGVVADSTATVIGAMIVAPMMVPIQAATLATVLGDRTNLGRSALLIVAGAGAVVGIGFLAGLLDPQPVVAATNTQVASRVSPGLIDLLAALATGIVGSVALVRKDIADTLPGVAIAISLVPPLAVAGLTLESGSIGQTLGALLLFATNVTAILATGMAVIGTSRVVRRVPPAPNIHELRRMSTRSVVVVAAMIVIVTVPLAAFTTRSITSYHETSTLQSVSDKWALSGGWRVTSITVDPNGSATIEAAGPGPAPAIAELRSALRQKGIETTDVTLRLVPERTQQLG